MVAEQSSTPMTGQVLHRPTGELKALWLAYAAALERERIAQKTLRKAKKQINK
jgi:hypothetical protein